MFERADKPLLITIIVLLAFGLIVFGSAALGVLAVNEAKFYAVIKTQLIYALVGGTSVLCLGALIPYQIYQKYAYHIFIGALFLTSLVFIPGIQMYHGGAHRWIDIGLFTLQPSEALKFGFVVVVAYWCTKHRNKFRSLRYGFLPYLIAGLLVSFIMLLQPDFGTYLVIMVASFFTFFVGGARRKHILFILVAGIIGFILLVSYRSYMLERVKTFFDSSQDLRGSSWQLNQALIALGGGGLTGRGLGQSVQKFNYLPEPIGDSVFAVMGEEAGFVGVVFLITLYGIVGVRAYIISKHARDQFGRLLAVGIVTIILTQASLNIGSMLGLVPLSGVPLPLVSHGGTALMVALFELGVLLNISKQSIEITV